MIDRNNKIIIFTDGASKGNPGPAGYGYQIISSPPGIDVRDSSNIGIATNNVAEYNGLLAGLARLITLVRDPTQIVIKGDSQLVIKQIQGVYRVKEPKLQELHRSATLLIDELKRKGHHITLEHIMREYNSVADNLASRASLM